MPTDQCLSRPVPSLRGCQMFSMHGIRLRPTSTGLQDSPCTHRRKRRHHQLPISKETRGGHAWRRLPELLRQEGSSIGCPCCAQVETVIRLRWAPFGLHYLAMVSGFVKISNHPEWQMAKENDFSSSVARWTCQVASGVGCDPI